MDAPLSEATALRLAPDEKRLLQYIAAQESERRGVDISVSWVIRMLINRHAMSYLNERNQRLFERHCTEAGHGKKE